MADKDDDLEIEESGVEESKGSNIKLIIIMVVVGLLFMAVGVGTTVLLLGGSNEEVVVEGEEEISEDELVEDKDTAVYFDIRPAFVVNYHMKGRIRYVQIHVELMARSEEVMETVEANMPLIKNNLVTLFSSTDFASLKSYEGKEELREAALEEVQKVMTQETGEPGVEAVLFTGFVIQ